MIRGSAILVMMLIFTAKSFSQNTIVGKWKTIDDETGNPTSVVEIYNKGENYFGKIVKLFPVEGLDPDPICDLCPADDSRYQQKIIGMEIIKDLEKVDNEYINGTVLKPDEGKIYKCKLWVENDLLKIRGYWGIFYRTQSWVRY